MSDGSESAWSFWRKQGRGLLRMSWVGIGAMCIGSVVGYFWRVWWGFDLFSHFRVHYLVGLSCVCLLLVVLRRWRSAAVVFAFACLNIWPIFQLFRGDVVDVGAGVQFRVMLINVNSRTGDPARVMAAIRAEDPDVLLLEELSERWRPLVDVLSQSYRGRCIDLREDNFGIGLFSRFGMQEQEIVQVGMTPVPTALASIGLGGEEIVVIGTHPLPPAGRAYSAGRNDHLAKLPRFVDAGRATVLMGDLNTTPWNGHFRVLLDESGLKDTSRGWGVQPTWPVANILLRIPLDHCLVSDRIVVLDRRIGGDVGSDHFPLIVDLVLLPSSE